MPVVAAAAVGTRDTKIRELTAECRAGTENTGTADHDTWTYTDHDTWAYTDNDTWTSTDNDTWTSTDHDTETYTDHDTGTFTDRDTGTYTAAPCSRPQLTASSFIFDTASN